jgi:hypothetical protein
MFEQFFLRRKYIGRAAAIFSEVYGSINTRALNAATKPDLLDCSARMRLSAPADTPLMTPRGILWAASSDQSMSHAKQLYDESKRIIPSLKMV